MNHEIFFYSQALLLAPFVKMKNLRFIILISVLLITMGGNQYISTSETSFSRKNLKDFPKDIGKWTLISDQKIDERTMKILNVDDYLMRSYRNENGEVIGLYIGYFKYQREGKKIHSPRQCLPGAGWNPVNIEIYHMPLPGHNPATVPVNKFIMGKGLERQLYLFWYNGRGRIYASEYWNKLYLIWDALNKRRTDGALIRVNSLVTGTTEKALEKQHEFIKIMFPLISEYIPK